MIDYLALYKEMTGSTKPERASIVQKIVRKLHDVFPGEITLEALADRFDATRSPLVRNGERSEKEAFYEFLNAWNTNEHKASLSDEQLTQFFLDLSSGIERNDFFESLALAPLALL